MDGLWEVMYLEGAQGTDLKSVVAYTCFNQFKQYLDV